MNVWLRKIANISAWLLLASVAVLVLSGWGITQTEVIYKLSFGLIDRRLADAIHRGSVVPLAFFFLLHVLINIRLKITSRRKSVVWLTNGVLIAIGICIMALVVYMEYFARGG
jgi:cytochrome b subunit of formate dehydrogenase